MTTPRHGYTGNKETAAALGFIELEGWWWRAAAAERDRQANERAICSHDEHSISVAHLRERAARQRAAAAAAADRARAASDREAAARDRDEARRV